MISEMWEQGSAESEGTRNLANNPSMHIKMLQAKL